MCLFVSSNAIKLGIKPLLQPLFVILKPKLRSALARISAINDDSDNEKHYLYFNKTNIHNMKFTIKIYQNIHILRSNFHRSFLIRNEF